MSVTVLRFSSKWIRQRILVTNANVVGIVRSRTKATEFINANVGAHEILQNYSDAVSCLCYRNRLLTYHLDKFHT